MTLETLLNRHSAMHVQLDAIEARMRAPAWEVGEALDVRARLVALLGVLRGEHGPEQRDLLAALPDAAFDAEPALLGLLAESEWLEEELAGLVEDARSPSAAEWDELYGRLGPFIFGLRQLMKQEEALLFPRIRAVTPAPGAPHSRAG